MKKKDIDDTLQEAKVLATLKHPNITNSYESFMDGNYFCIITEYCEVSEQQKKKEQKESDFEV